MKPDDARSYKKIQIQHEKTLMDQPFDARREILLDATLGDEIPLTALDNYVRKQYPNAPTNQVQQKVLSIIREFVADELVTLGAMTGPNGNWEEWRETLELSMQRISDSYVGRSYQSGNWWFSVWLRGTSKGRKLVLRS